MNAQARRSTSLANRRVLVIEDEYYLADDISRALTALGASVIGPYGDLDEAAGAVERDVAIDVAIMDINLHDKMVFPLARVLRSRKVPLVFTTGYDQGAIEPEFQDVRLWNKPLDIKAMTNELANIIKGA